MCLGEVTNKPQGGITVHVTLKPMLKIEQLGFSFPSVLPVSDISTLHEILERKPENHSATIFINLNVILIHFYSKIKHLKNKSVKQTFFSFEKIIYFGTQ